jgi:hypothetical protein
MSKAIYVCSRNHFFNEVTKSRLTDICNELTPDNISVMKPRVMITEHVSYGVWNPSSTLSEEESSLALGTFFGDSSRWHLPLHDYPDGSFAIFRDGTKYCEIVTDPAASRTIWYYLDDELFIASSSQRAICMYLGSFELDDSVIPWILSTGSLGPTHSWDRRLKRIPPDSSVLLDKEQWTISTRSFPIEFVQLSESDDGHEELLRSSLYSVIGSLGLNFSDWALPLSGGYDSRGILCLMINGLPDSEVKRLQTITWGLESDIEIKDSDACVAGVLSKTLGVSNKYFHNDWSEETVEVILDRFLLQGEGRIDHFSTYLDGFAIWKTLFQDGIQGVIRGDECFGYKSVRSATNTRLVVGCGLCSDYSNLKNYQKYGIPEQILPESLHQKDGESLALWRDRLYQEYRLPVILSALTDLKSSYVEIINPLLSRQVLRQVRRLPDHLRSDKALFAKIVDSLSPNVGFAVASGRASSKVLLREKKMTDVLVSELSSKSAEEIFSYEFLSFVLSDIKEERKKPNDVAGIGYSIVSKTEGLVLSFLKKAARPKVDGNVLAFRVYMIIKMHKILKIDGAKYEEKKYVSSN